MVGGSPDWVLSLSMARGRLAPKRSVQSAEYERWYGCKVIGI